MISVVLSVQKRSPNQMAMGRELASEWAQELPSSVVIATRKCRRKVVATPHDSKSDIDTAMRCHAELLGERILQRTQGTAIRKRTLRLSSGYELRIENHSSMKIPTPSINTIDHSGFIPDPTAMRTLSTGEREDCRPVRSPSRGLRLRSHWIF